ncbi:hypothetical protein H4219_002716 [Mycoemilia scoparia]|uniref:ubiquitinyl hydrolase 1 n=1 Tax=Mycoemilia scoparia TaxID=417184 RepID=A0A9W7ZWT5_9FUNG|nr:hypothetical protein H4219_002716 [Mycoemilia scoparia]
MPLIQPRGLVNAGNTCFMNVVFQSLLYCAPFYNALRQIREKVAFSFNSRIPLVESLIMFLNEFPKCDTKEDPFDFDHTYDIEPFVPQFVYDALDRKKIFRTMKGSQEDAQEFMGYLLDGIHEELMSAVIYTRAVPSDNVYTLHSAFEELVHKEILECYMGINGTKVDATKQLTLESVPQVLVLHLKRFIFCPEKGIQKIHKFVAYRESFEISPQWVSRLDQHKIRNAKYELKTVIYHHGESAGGGHYTCDISRAPGEWVRFDDVDIDYLESEASVLCEKDDRHAYILFYQRVD